MKEQIELANENSNYQFIDMSTNYRTCDSIIQFVNHAFQEIMRKEEASEDQGFKIHYTKIDSNRMGNKEEEIRVELIAPANEKEAEEPFDEQTEYELLANRMLSMIEEKQPLVYTNGEWCQPSWRDYAILIQARTKLSQLEQALKEKEIPYVIYGGIGFYERQEVRDMLMLLNWLNRPWEALYITALLRSPLYGVTLEDLLTIDEYRKDKGSLAHFVYNGLYHEAIGMNEHLKHTLEKLRTFYRNWIPYFPQTATKDYLYQLFCESGLKMALLLQRNNLQLVKNVEKLIDILVELQTASLEELLKKVRRLTTLAAKEGEAEVELAEGNAVHIMTVHASKGLEFPIVLLPDLARAQRADSGNICFDQHLRLAVRYKKEVDMSKKAEEKFSPAFQLLKAKTREQAIEEAKRLFYVAVTRARDYLVLSALNKPANDSWYDMLLNAFEENKQLQHYVKPIEHVAKIDKWQAAEQLYEAPLAIDAIKQKPLFSVSEILTFINDPLRYFYKYIVKVEEGWLAAESSQHASEVLNEEVVGGATFGSIVHRACELLDVGYDDSQAKEEALAVITDELERDRYREPLTELVGNFQLFKELDLGVTVENEWSFAVEIEGAIITGQVDKIANKNGLYHIIDLKTNKGINDQELIVFYAPQLYLYKLAFEQEFNEPVAKLSLFFLRAREKGLQTVEISELLKEKVRAAIREMADLKRRNANKEEYLQFL